MVCFSWNGIGNCKVNRWTPYTFLKEKEWEVKENMHTKPVFAGISGSVCKKIHYVYHREFFAHLPYYFSFIHLSSQHFCGRNERLELQKFSKTLQLLSILLAPLRWCTAQCLGFWCCWCRTGGHFIEHFADIQLQEFCITRGNMPWHVKAGGWCSVSL